MEVVDNATAETPQAQDLNALRQRLVEDVSRALQVDKKSPEFKPAMLNIMGQLEKARETLGPFCATVGEGKDRTIVFTNPRDVEVVSGMVLSIEPQTDYGPVRTTYRERLLVNRAGVYTISSVRDQKLDYDPNQRVPTTTIENRQFDPALLIDWANRNSPLVRHYGADSERILGPILASGRYPEITIEQPISGSGKHLTPEEDAEYHRQSAAYHIGTYGLSPNNLKAGVSSNGFTFSPPPKDTEREAQPLGGWATGGDFQITQVTKPETVQAAFQNIPAPSPHSTPLTYPQAA